jgi:spore coat protein CotF
MTQTAGQNQQSQQGQMGGQSAQISDRDIMQICLNESKHLATSLNIYIQEAANEQLRRDYMSILGEVYSQEKQLYDYMQQKGYYNVKNASPQDISQAQGKFSSQPQQQGMQ